MKTAASLFFLCKQFWPFLPTPLPPEPVTEDTAFPASEPSSVDISPDCNASVISRLLFDDDIFPRRRCRRVSVAFFSDNFRPDDDDDEVDEVRVFVDTATVLISGDCTTKEEDGR